MKSKVVYGTPINHIGPNGAFIGNREGYSAVPPRGPEGYNGTVNRQYEGEQSTNRQNGATGTPANNVLGNPNETSRTRSDYRYGVSLGAGGQDYNNPAANGNGVVFDGISRERGYNAKDADAMDSPVREGAPQFDTRTIRQENLAHLGQGIGADPAQIADDIMKIPGGVMSRDDGT